MDIRKLQRAIVDGLEDVKAQNIAVFNTEHLSPLFERVIIASGTSNRQTKALASSVRETVKSRGMDVMRTEGEDNGEWIIVDCGAAVAHIMQPAIRDYYHLEEIWGGKAVRMKLGDEKVVRLPKASEPEPAPEPAPTARKAQAAGKKAAQNGAKSAADRGAKKAPKNTPSKAPASARNAAAGKATAAKPGARMAAKNVAKKAAPRSAPAKKPAARKAAPRRG